MKIKEWFTNVQQWVKTKMAGRVKKTRKGKKTRRGGITAETLRFFVPRVAAPVILGLWFWRSPWSAGVFSLLFLGGLAVVWFVLAPRNLLWTFVSEGTVKIVVRGGRPIKFLCRTRGKEVDQKTGKVKQSKVEKRPFWGGLCWIGLPFIDQVLIYKLSWRSVQEDGQVSVHNDEELDYVMIMDGDYFIHLEKVEDKVPMPCKTDVIFVGRVENIYDAMYKVENFYKRAAAIMRDAVRNVFGKHTYAEMQSLGTGNLSKKIFDEAQAGREELKKRYGFTVVSIQISELDPSDEYREDTTREYRADQKKKAQKKDGEAEADFVSAAAGVITDPDKKGEVAADLLRIRAMEKLNPNLQAVILGGKVNLGGLSVKKDQDS